jgi:hypothetical protein
VPIPIPNTNEYAYSDRYIYSNVDSHVNRNSNHYAYPDANRSRKWTS